MLTEFKVRNYKNFKETLVFSFDQIGKYKYNADCLHLCVVAKAVVYSKNSTGKSNLGRALLDIKQMLLGDGKAAFSNPGEKFLNAESVLPYMDYE